MVCGSHAKTRAMYSTPPCPSLATSTAAYRRRSFSDSQPKNRFIFCSTSAEYPSMPHSLIRGLLCSKDTAAQAIREVILDHILKKGCRASEAKTTCDGAKRRSVERNPVNVESQTFRHERRADLVFLDRERV